MSVVIDGLSWIFLCLGSLFCLIGGTGVLRMPDFYTRMHAASVTDTLGAGFILAGLLLQAGLTLIAAKLMMVGLLIFMASPAAAHALAKAALARGLQPKLAPNEENPSSTR